MNKRKFLNISLVNELFDLEEETIIRLNRNMMIYNASDLHLHFIKPFLDTLGSELWWNYFENKVTPNKKTNIPKLVCLAEKKWRYTILHSNNGMLSKEEIIALRLSDLRLNILVQCGFDLNSKGEIPDDETYQRYVSKNSFETFNLLIQTSDLISNIGSEKFVRKLPDKNDIRNFQQFLNKIKKIFDDNELLFIKKSLEDFFRWKLFHKNLHLE